MDTLTIRCPNCGAAITEKPKSDFVKCAFCDTVFKMSTNHISPIASDSVKYVFVIKSNVLIEYNGESTEIIVPSNVEKISDGVFRNSGLTSVLLPESLKEIGAYAFADCRNLCSIVIPENVYYIGNRAFWRCTNLSQIDFLGENTQLGEGVILCTEIYKNFLQEYDSEVKAQLEKEAFKRRKVYGLCPYCGSNYNIWGKCKGCGRKKE